MTYNNGPRVETHYVVVIEVKRATKTIPPQGSAATPSRDVVDELRLTRTVPTVPAALEWAISTLTTERNLIAQAAQDGPLAAKDMEQVQELVRQTVRRFQGHAIVPEDLVSQIAAELTL